MVKPYLLRIIFYIISGSVTENIIVLLGDNNHSVKIGTKVSKSAQKMGCGRSAPAVPEKVRDSMSKSEAGSYVERLKYKNKPVKYHVRLSMSSRYGVKNKVTYHIML